MMQSNILIVLAFSLTFLDFGSSYWFFGNRKSALKANRVIRPTQSMTKVLAESSITLRADVSNHIDQDSGTIDTAYVDDSLSLDLDTKDSSNVDTANADDDSRSSRSVGFGATIVRAIMASPLYYPIVWQARRTMVNTAQGSGIDWESKYDYMREKIGDNEFESRVNLIRKENEGLNYPDYYLSKFHGYKFGNLCKQSALEQEIAGKAVGARNFPQEGKNGEEVLRKSYEKEILYLCGESILSSQGIDSRDFVVADFGCGSGTSTRRLAKMIPTANKIIGIDMSPHMLALARYLNDVGTKKEEWVEDITPDPRIQFTYSDITKTEFCDNSVDICSISLVLHELPERATLEVIKEAERILKPGGTLLIMEMDPQAPGYISLRKNAALFAILRSTEPFLDEYFDLAPQIPDILMQSGFGHVQISAATGRHLVIAAKKVGAVDVRPTSSERQKQDFHLGTLQR